MITSIKSYDFLIGAPKNFGFFGKICGDNYYRWLEVDVIYKESVVKMDNEIISLIDQAISTLSDIQKIEIRSSRIRFKRWLNQSS
jgi:hypothetical protein